MRSDSDVDELQAGLDVLDRWSKKWLLPINHSKCCVFPEGGRQPFGVYHLGGYLLREATTERDLGVLTSSDLKMRDESHRKAVAGSKLMWAIRRSFQSLTPEVFKILFTSHIRPILEYGQPAYHPITKQANNRLEMVQRRGSKAVLGLRDVSYPERLLKLGLFPLEYRRHRGDLIYTWKIINGKLGEDLLNYFQLITNSNTRGHPFKLYKHRRFHLNPMITLSTRVVNAWNGLPAEVVAAKTEKEFKKKLDEHCMNTAGGSCLFCNLQPSTHGRD
jgi:hypothetical protein